jgi:hypothetical protein
MKKDTLTLIVIAWNLAAGFELEFVRQRFEIVTTRVKFGCAPSLLPKNKPRRVVLKGLTCT